MLDPKKTFSTLQLLEFVSSSLEIRMVQEPRLERTREGAEDRVHFGGGLGKEYLINSKSNSTGVWAENSTEIQNVLSLT